MRFWFGRKSAAADVRPCVPAWLGGEGRGGFARDFHAQFEEVFRRNPVGQRAVLQRICRRKFRRTAHCRWRGRGGAGLVGPGQAPIRLLVKARNVIG